MTRRLPSELVTRAVAGSTLEWKLTDPMAFGLTTASSLQRAVCRAIDGVPLGALGSMSVVKRAFGGTIPTEKPREAALLSGIRSAKSLIAACLGFHMAVSCDVSKLRSGEVPRVSVVSLRKDLADVVMGHLVGSLQASKLLSPFIIGDPDSESVMIRHPSGVPVEIKVVAGSRAGASLVARWSAGCIFDEFPRMVGADEAVVNWDDSRGAVVHRLLFGAQMFHIGSPWAPYGPAFELVTKHHGKPTKDIVVIRATAQDMNPIYWTPERVENAKADPDTYRTDVLAEFASPDEAFYSSESVDKCTRKTPLVVGPKQGNTYYAAMDPATRGNGWTLAIATRESGKTVVVRAEEWMGTRDEPLNPGNVLAEAAGILTAYGISAVDSDQVMGDALVALGRQVGLRVVQWRYTEPERAKKHIAIRTRMDMGEIELPPVPRMRTDLLHVRKKITPGGIGVALPQTSDGRHCDWAPTLMLVLSRLLPEPTVVLSSRKGDDPETKRMRDLVRARFAKKEEW